MKQEVKYYDANGEELLPGVDPKDFAKFVTVEDYKDMVLEAEKDKKKYLNAMVKSTIPLRTIINTHTAVAISTSLKRPETENTLRLANMSVSTALALIQMNNALETVHAAISALPMPYISEIESALATVNTVLMKAETGQWI